MYKVILTVQEGKPEIVGMTPIWIYRYYSIQ
jgi:hypothetical protein